MPWPAGTDLISQGDEAIRSLAETVDGLMATDSQGTFAARPAAGKSGRYYRATDTGVLYRDNGTSWDVVATDSASAKVKGRSIIATEEVHTSGAAYGLLPTPDRVSGLVVPANAIVRVGFQGMWKESVDGAARAAIFIGANQLKVAHRDTAAPIVQEARCQGAAGAYVPLSSAVHGLTGAAGASPGGYAGDVTTGQVLGFTDNAASVDAPGAGVSGYGFVEIHGLAAATYDFAVMVKASAGTVTAKNRSLWAEVRDYA